jgi:hypothetical protein
MNAQGAMFVILAAKRSLAANEALSRRYIRLSRGKTALTADLLVVLRTML